MFSIRQLMLNNENAEPRFLCYIFVCRCERIYYLFDWMPQIPPISIQTIVMLIDVLVRLL
jgi:hypothetical protein